MTAGIVDGMDESQIEAREQRARCNELTLVCSAFREVSLTGRSRLCVAWTQTRRAPTKDTISSHIPTRGCRHRFAVVVADDDTRSI